jgi:signal transduction histidine kinase/DNA-binding response OmpR family regulator
MVDDVRKRILVIEDERDIAELIRLHLEDLDFSVSISCDGNTGLRKASIGSWDLIILDLRLPGIDGLEICRRVRQDSSSVPILMLTSTSSELDRVVGLEIGADDYVTKPFSVLELIARVKAILRRAELSRGGVVKDKTYRADRQGVRPAAALRDAPRSGLSTPGVTGQRLGLWARRLRAHREFAYQPAAFQDRDRSRTSGIDRDRVGRRLQDECRNRQTRNRMRRLHFKLSGAMFIIVLLLGAAFYAIDRYSIRLYHEELSQRLNASLAMYVVNAGALIKDGDVDREALDELSNRAMVINPTAEIYLLAPDGEILGHALPPDEVITNRVELSPVLDLVDGSASLPIKGVDPRNPGSRKIFSAFPVTDPADPENISGYLYVVLGGSQYEAVAAQVSDSDKQRMIAAGILLLVLAAFGAGALLFSYLTSRLRRLTGEVSAFTAGRFDTGGPVTAVAEPRDEIDQLRNACHYMATTIQQQIATLQEDDRLRRELVTNISHDLRTPLASMQGYIETLIIKDDSLDVATRAKYLEIARKHAMHLGRLIQDLFELAMLDADRVTPELEHFSLPELIQDVVQEFELQAKAADVSLEVNPPDAVVSAYADISLIQRVLENLVGNALKYTPAGGTVSVSVRRSAAAVSVSVADTGQGIPEDALPRIFDRFYKADQQDKQRDGSMGLGLAIAKRILELHSSEISVVSKESQGTQFHFELPLQARAA